MNTFSSSLSTAFSLITSFDPLLGGIVLRSLAVSACACLLACSAGLLLGGWLGVARFRGRGVVLALLNTALALGVVLLGVVLLLNVLIALVRRWREHRDGSFAGASLQGHAA